MAPHHRSRIGASRRRVEDEGEDDEYIGGDTADDSLSEGTASSHEDDEDGDGEGSDISEHPPADLPETNQPGQQKQGSDLRASESTGQTGATDKGPLEQRVSETEAMLNGMNLAQTDEEAAEIHFDEIKPEDDTSTPQESKPQKHESFAERKRREHEQYIRKRDKDPAFVPNRGGFFLHDNRRAPNSSNGYRAGNNKSKSKPHGLIVDSTMGRPPAPKPDTGGGQWAHDLHDSVNQDVHPAQTQSSSGPYPYPATRYAAKPFPTAPRSSPPNRSFSSTVLVGNVPVVVFLPGMASPIPFMAVPKKQHTRLPQHRPPLRRDKPVRISLPGKPPRYIFPATDRSFIFIPRALRPNQQAYQQRGRGRGGFHGSRRTSVYSGSAYTPSVTMSRRSSIGREASAEVHTPGGSTISRPAVLASDTGRPVVRLPPSARAPAGGAPSSHIQPTIGPHGPQPPVYPPPQNPQFRENRPHPTIPMHQPRPQKAVSVADIEPPMSFALNPPHSQQEQPFHHQVPQPMNGHTFISDSSGYPSHTRHISHPPPGSATPLSQIPERAIHAPPFQPVPYQPPQPYYPPSGFSSGPVSYPTANPEYPPYTGAFPAGGPPQFPSGPPTSSYGVPAQTAPDQQANAGTVAHESNGTVYYYDASQVPNATYPNPQFPVAPQGGVVGMGGMMTPPGPAYFYGQPPNGSVYYS